ncbi:MAG: hypothetical protein Q9182_005735 [Xanthomendoza sp. 2 TL-2023]
MPQRGAPGPKHRERYFHDDNDTFSTRPMHSGRDRAHDNVPPHQRTHPQDLRQNVQSHVAQAQGYGIAIQPPQGQHQLFFEVPYCPGNPDVNHLLRVTNTAPTLNPMQGQFAAFSLNPPKLPQTPTNPFLADSPQQESPKEVTDPFLANPLLAGRSQSEGPKNVFDRWNDYIEAREGNQTSSEHMSKLLGKLESRLDEYPSCQVWTAILDRYCQDVIDHNKIDKRLRNFLAHTFFDLDIHSKLNQSTAFNDLKRDPNVAPELVTFMLEALICAKIEARAERQARRQEFRDKNAGTIRM